MTTMTIEGVRHSFWSNDYYTVSLWNEAERRLFDMSIGQPEAYVLVMERHHLPSLRPATIHLMVNAFKALNITIEEVRIEGYQTSPIPFFCAVVRLHNGETVQEIDARPSDALCLAAMSDCPIVVADELLNTTGITLEEGKTPEQYYAEQLLKREKLALPEGKKLRLGYNKTPARDAVLKEVKAALHGIPQPPTVDEYKQARHAYLAFLLGDNYEQYYTY